MKITFIGIGNVGSALADNLAKAGHTVSIAARDISSESVKAALALNPKLTALPTEQAVSEAHVVFLATPYAANASALAGLSLDDKIVVDCTNPVGAGLTHGLQSKESGSEAVQRLAPAAKVVKAFTIYGYENFKDTSYPGFGNLKPAMLMAGDHASARKSFSSWPVISDGSRSMPAHFLPHFNWST